MFFDKLNKKEEGYHSIKETVTIKSGVYEGILRHDNVNPDSIMIVDSSGKSVDNYMLSTPEDKSWETHIKIFHDKDGEVDIFYETPGDIVDADDINKIQDYLIELSNQGGGSGEIPQEEIDAIIKQIETIKNNKADKEHTHSADDIRETFFKNFVSAADKIRIGEIDDKADRDETQKQLDDKIEWVNNMSGKRITLYGTTIDTEWGSNLSITDAIDQKADKDKVVTSVNGQTGDVIIEDGGGTPGVSSVNGKSGRVTLTGEDIKATSGLLKPSVAEELDRLDSDVDKKADKDETQKQLDNKIERVNNMSGKYITLYGNFIDTEWGSGKSITDAIKEKADKSNVVTSVNGQKGDVVIEEVDLLEVKDSIANLEKTTAKKEHTHSANDIQETFSKNFISMSDKLKIQDIDSKADKVYVDKKYDDLKKSVSDGKTKVADSITQRGVATKPTDTFDTMAHNILEIPSGGGQDIADIHPKNIIFIPKQIEQKGVKVSTSGLGSGQITKIIDNGDFIGVRYGSGFGNVYFLSAKSSKSIGRWEVAPLGCTIYFNTIENTYKTNYHIYNRYGEEIGETLYSSGNVLFMHSEKPYIVFSELSTINIENGKTGNIVQLGNIGDEFLRASDDLIAATDYNSNWTMDIRVFNWKGEQVSAFDTKEDIEGMDVMGNHIYYINYGATNYLHKVNSAGDVIWKVALPRKLKHVHANGGLIGAYLGQSLVIYDINGNMIQDFVLMSDFDGTISSLFFGKYSMTIGTGRAEILRYDYKNVDVLYSEERL